MGKPPFKMIVGCEHKFNFGPDLIYGNGDKAIWLCKKCGFVFAGINPIPLKEKERIIWNRLSK
jgi:hypothetical protein